MDDAQAINKQFAEKAKEVNLAGVPHKFTAGDTVYFNEIIENIMVILEARVDQKLREGTQKGNEV